MIEQPGLPIGWVVATVALVTKPTTVCVIVTVTCDTVVRGVVKRCGLMTSIAGQVRVFADQWKICDVMVEPQLCIPVGRNMAGFAACAQLSFVHVVAAVTGSAFPWQLIVQVCSMT